MGDLADEKPWWRYAVLTVPAIVLLGSASGWLSGSGYGNPWFDALSKPSFMPPGWLFGLVWPVLYALLGLSVALVLAERGADGRREALLLFWVQLALNFAWSPIFFAAHDLGLAKIVVFVMAAIAAATAGKFYRIRRGAGLLLLPYLAWLVFAAVLTSSIESLNPGAGRSLLGIG